MKTNVFDFEGMNHEEKIRNAAQNLRGTIKKTDLIYSDFFSKEYGNNVYIKPENLQVTGSFKVRGAFNKIANLTDEEKSKRSCHFLRGKSCSRELHYQHKNQE